MPEVIPQRFRKSSPSIASYDYLDYVSGAGYRTFYAVNGEDSTGVFGFLSPVVMDSAMPGVAPLNDRRLQVATSATATVNYDITFGTSATIAGGEVYVNYSTRGLASGSTGSAVFTLKRVRGADSTTIATSTSPTISTGGSESYYRRGFKMTATETLLVDGDVLRLTVALTSVSGAGIIINIDPSNLLGQVETSTSVVIPTSLIMRVPFVVDI